MELSTNQTDSVDPVGNYKLDLVDLDKLLSVAKRPNVRRQLEEFKNIINKQIHNQSRVADINRKYDNLKTFEKITKYTLLDANDYVK